ncbi:MAG: hypothetical protein ACRDYV_00055 [Acidimicrobiia bacterium]
MSGDDLYDDPAARAWARDVREELLPKLTASAVVCSLVPRDGEPDPKFCVELGMSIMLDKPIIAVVTPGRKAPERLARVADRIIEADLDTAAGRDRLAASLNAAMRELRDEDGG